MENIHTNRWMCNFPSNFFRCYATKTQRTYIDKEQNSKKIGQNSKKKKKHFSSRFTPILEDLTDDVTKVIWRITRKVKNVSFWLFLDQNVILLKTEIISKMGESHQKARNI